MAEVRNAAEHTESSTAAKKGRRSGMPGGLTTLQALQGGAGNRAVTALLERDTDEDEEEGQSSPGGDGISSPGKGDKATGTTKKATPKTSKTKEKPWTTAEIAAFKKRKKHGLDVFKLIAKRDTANAVALIRAAADWDRIIGDVPEGSKIPKSGRHAIFVVVASEALTVPEAAKLFKKRFRHELTAGTGADTAAWTPTTITRVWKQLDLLPESDVSHNTVVGAFTAVKGGGGMFGGAANSIDIGQEADATKMAHTVRHEVGHGVHAEIPGVVNTWLQNDIGMWYGELDDTGVDTFVAELGGYPATYVNPNDSSDEAFADTEKTWIRHFIQSWTGRTSWEPTRVSPETGSGTWETAAWSAMPAQLQNACTQSTKWWFQNYASFQKGSSGDRLFLNHWYHKWFRMSDAAKKLVDITGEDYTAMSEKEMFANAYAEYFADPKGKKDPSKWGGKLSASVKEFFQTCIVNRDPYDKYQKSQKKKLTSK